jgi:hypothetical protein
MFGDRFFRRIAGGIIEPSGIYSLVMAETGVKPRVKGLKTKRCVSKMGMASMVSSL